MKQFLWFSICGSLVSAATTTSSAAPAAVSLSVEDGPQEVQAAGSSNIIKVAVGSVNGDGTVSPSFSPNSISAKTGDTIRFLVEAGTVKIIQTTLDDPCRPANDAATSKELSNPDSRTPAPSLDFVVDNSSPIFFTTSDLTACKAGNVLAVNTDGSNGGYTDFVRKAAVQNGEGSNNQGIVVDSAVAQTSASLTVTIGVQGQGSASPTGNVGESGSNGSGAPPRIVNGQGQRQSGQSCGCQCLCGTTTFPRSVGVGMFGGFLGAMPQAPTSPQTASRSTLGLESLSSGPSRSLNAPERKRTAVPAFIRGQSF